MADVFELGAEATELFLEASLSKRVIYSGVSAVNCIECDEEIPEKRRQSIKGCKHCTDCASLLELKSKQYSNRPT